MPYGITGATNAFTRGAISRAIATGARMSAPFAVTPCGSSVPRGRSTVWTRPGTHSWNSIQFRRSSSRVRGGAGSAAPRGTAMDSRATAARIISAPSLLARSLQDRRGLVAEILDGQPIPGARGLHDLEVLVEGLQQRLVLLAHAVGEALGRAQGHADVEIAVP